MMLSDTLQCYVVTKSMPRVTLKVLQESGLNTVK